ncbi:MAG: hypothetical protein SV775_15585 [Thermodesulfobacteriota bacterium]|nr:hypothetical protein [Thermodesulfobacteriota bacterium]
MSSTKNKLLLRGFEVVRLYPVGPNSNSTAIKGCPFCDNINNINMHFAFSRWTIVTNDGKTYIEIKWCPFCGNKLPSLIGWGVMENGTESVVVSTKNQSREKKEWP